MFHPLCILNSFCCLSEKWKESLCGGLRVHLIILSMMQVSLKTTQKKEFFLKLNTLNTFPANFIFIGLPRAKLFWPSWICKPWKNCKKRKKPKTHQTHTHTHTHSVCTGHLTYRPKLEANINGITKNQREKGSREGGVPEGWGEGQWQRLWVQIPAQQQQPKLDTYSKTPVLQVGLRSGVLEKPNLNSTDVWNTCQH
jgi:hypothetical protein